MVEGLIEELEKLADDASGKRKHLLEAKEDAEFFMQSGIGWMIKGFQEGFCTYSISGHESRVGCRFTF